MADESKLKDQTWDELRAESNVVRSELETAQGEKRQGLEARLRDLEEHQTRRSIEEHALHTPLGDLYRMASFLGDERYRHSLIDDEAMRETALDRGRVLRNVIEARLNDYHEAGHIVPIRGVTDEERAGQETEKAPWERFRPSRVRTPGKDLSLLGQDLDFLVEREPLSNLQDRWVEVGRPEHQSPELHELGLIGTKDAKESAEQRRDRVPAGASIEVYRAAVADAIDPVAMADLVRTLETETRLRGIEGHQLSLADRTNAGRVELKGHSSLLDEGDYRTRNSVFSAANEEWEKLADDAAETQGSYSPKRFSHLRSLFQFHLEQQNVHPSLAQARADQMARAAFRSTRFRQAREYVLAGDIDSARKVLLEAATSFYKGVSAESYSQLQQRANWVRNAGKNNASFQALGWVRQLVEKPRVRAVGPDGQVEPRPSDLKLAGIWLSSLELNHNLIPRREFFRRHGHEFEYSKLGQFEGKLPKDQIVRWSDPLERLMGGFRSASLRDLKRWKADLGEEMKTQDLDATGARLSVARQAIVLEIEGRVESERYQSWWNLAADELADQASRETHPVAFLDMEDRLAELEGGAELLADLSRDHVRWSLLPMDTVNAAHLTEEASLLHQEGVYSELRAAKQQTNYEVKTIDDVPEPLRDEVRASLSEQSTMSVKLGLIEQGHDSTFASALVDHVQKSRHQARGAQKLDALHQGLISAKPGEVEETVRQVLDAYLLDQNWVRPATLARVDARLAQLERTINEQRGMGAAVIKPLRESWNRLKAWREKRIVPSEWTRAARAMLTAYGQGTKRELKHMLIKFGRVLGHAAVVFPPLKAAIQAGQVVVHAAEKAVHQAKNPELDRA